MQQQNFERIMLGRDLRQAMKKGELQIHYQPIVELESGRIVKAEALLRWAHSRRGMISPDLFIPIAEESGMIVEIGEWLFDEAASRVRDWQTRFGSAISLSINESPMQFSKFSTEKSWLQKLDELGLPRNSIAIEITEGLLLNESCSSRERLKAFHEGGIEISIDDFGTGFSSFSYLRQFEVDYLKIDRSFISGLTVSRQDRAITEAVIGMAHKLGIRIIAEGVETADQRDLLSSFGCDYGQGFLFSRPLPAEEFERLLEKSCTQ
ncbi:MAG TPA: EAL domain-containing protein, partial [Burkholderiales bacterium]|nr:EAL domain-containing protein [Burkholderiales bacterium]